MYNIDFQMCLGAEGAILRLIFNPHRTGEDLPDILRVKNWSKFQHYKHRRPPWIKFHKTLLDDPDFQCLPVASKALAPMLWLIASEELDGTIGKSPRELSFRLRLAEVDLMQAVKPLIDNGFFEAEGVYASNMLATCLQHATPEYRVQSTEKFKTIGQQTALTVPSSFDTFWSAYPKKVGKIDAKKAWNRIPGVEVNYLDILEGLEKLKPYWSDPQFIMNPAKFLNGQRWKDEVPSGKAFNKREQSQVATLEAARRTMERHGGEGASAVRATLPGKPN